MRGRWDTSAKRSIGNAVLVDDNTNAKIRARKRVRWNFQPPKVRVVLPKYHTPSCGCAECFTAGQRYADYEKAKRLREEL